MKFLYKKTYNAKISLKVKITSFRDDNNSLKLLSHRESLLPMLLKNFVSIMFLQDTW